MDVLNYLNSIELEDIEKLFAEYRALGPFVAILLPLAESFLPFLPLFIFVVANANSFGFWLGSILSWIGTASGSILVFLLVRKFGQERFFRFLSKHEKIRRMMNWVERHGFGPLFIMLCFPFTPSAAINVVAGLSRINIWQFVLAVLTGKIVMIFTISFIGHDLRELILQPFRTVIVFIMVVILWFVGKRIEAHLNVSFVQKSKNKF
ncbi:TVP38/TMEM64 family protein [Aeribacillus alveayuensis]|uniref:TVP38/TMEM64 family membrane protein n=1 Tax=Aeribacillus alveayuensis TaxID=279215 RepID=A0ABT9VN03_9BACI|nr:putative membrane protein YdjX (TVP38/TMEM64 family) [Bacillus alveayuensis]